MLAGLSVAETVSWGILYYSFSVFIRPIEREMGWSRTEVTGALLPRAPGGRAWPRCPSATGSTPAGRGR